MFISGHFSAKGSYEIFYYYARSKTCLRSYWMKEYCIFCLFRTLKYQAPAGQYRANLFVTENIECLSMWKGLYSYPFVCNTLQIYTIFNIFNMFANTKVTIIAKFGSVVILATYTCFATKLEGRFPCSPSTHLAALEEWFTTLLLIWSQSVLVE